ncbi:septation protein SepH [Leucobacter sp. W1153]|uniref:septation protein SepH n=1 Tax=Leucobacter sp. W1153 TaxID=3439064 RepID=UPI003F350A59
MDELRFVRREDQSLVVADDAGNEHRLVVDETVFAELRHLSRRERETPRVSPREIQSLVRAGKSRAEIVEITGAEDTDIERYEEPVLAERRFILASAHAVSVRTSPIEGSEQQFGTVIAERLVGLGAADAEWRSWRDEEAGWMIGLDFTSHEVAHRAIWSFEHRKGLLAPLTPDAVTLSQQGEVGERLIPKLRAVDANPERDRFDSGAFDPEKLSLDLSDDDAAQASPASSGAEAARAAGHPSTGSIPIVDSTAEFARRREIDQRAIKSTDHDLPDLGQTADLLDALRRRRGERETHAQDGLPVAPFAEASAEDRTGDSFRLTDIDSSAQASDPAPSAGPSGLPGADAPALDEKPKRGRGRTAIPSWDDILFGTRSDEDPA